MKMTLQRSPSTLMGQPIHGIHAVAPDRGSGILLVHSATGDDALDRAMALQVAEAHGIAGDIDFATITDTDLDLD